MSHQCGVSGDDKFCLSGGSAAFALYCSGERDEDTGQVHGACAELTDAQAMEDPAWNAPNDWQPWWNDFPKCLRAERLSLDQGLIQMHEVRGPNPREECDRLAELSVDVAYSMIQPIDGSGWPREYNCLLAA